MTERILILSHAESTAIGGMEVADRALAASLSDLGFAVESWWYDTLLPRYIRGTSRQLLFPLAVARRARKQPSVPDVVESTAGDAHWAWATCWGRALPRPLLSIRTHGLEHARVTVDRTQKREQGIRPNVSARLYHYRYRLWEVARDLRSADAVFLLNRADRDVAVDLGLAVPDRTHVLPNGVSDEVLQLPLAERSGFQRLLFVGGWTPSKGAHLVPDILETVVERFPGVRLTCAGVRMEPEHVLSAFPGHLRSRVSVLQQYSRSDLPVLLESHDVFLAPTLAEGCSLALLEAMSVGLVPVVSAVGAAVDIVVDGDNGFLVADRSAAAFAESVCSVISRPTIGSRMSVKARHAVASLSWESLARQRVERWRASASRVDRTGIGLAQTPRSPWS